MDNLYDLERLERSTKQTAISETITKTVEIEAYNIITKHVQFDVISLQKVREAILTHVPEIIQLSLDGIQDPLHAFRELRELGKIVQSAICEMQNICLDEAEKYTKDELRASYKLEIGYTGEFLDYEQDLYVVELERQLNERKSLLKLASQGKTVVCKITGEILRPCTIKTPSKPYIKTTK
jgi:hypothetical protein